ncbi:type II toxin-antitoxin system RelE/ParE family toxin [Amphibiibacter pelophylacis]|uniref:type II toxin-antitoxin system RelE/ParE family toxin n=1 Tax=Amphibiibacter pelophylacis TaxID=1799477 RepID=UPI003BFA72ED
MDILRYTAKTWGPIQLAAYRDRLDQALTAISADPLAAGHGRPDLPASHRSRQVGSHLIIYRLEPNGVGVVRILHQRMSLARHL